MQRAGNDALRQGLSTFLETLPGSRRCLVAYSGGMDSHVLLHLMSAAGVGCGLRAAHVNHNVQAQGRDWARHCRETCRTLDVELQVLEVDASDPGGESPENWAREQRYGALKNILAEGEVLLTAHHQDDQLETLLLRLLRGAGVLGLAAMRPVRRFGQGFHARPLLQYSHAQLLDYAEAQQLRWVEDPSNTDTRIDRNYVRHEVLPVIQRRWPSVALPVSRTVQACAEAQELLDELACRDLQDCTAAEPDVLLVEPLQRLSAPRQKNLVRHWCRALNLPPPNSRHLSHILSDVIAARPDAHPRVNWKGAELRRHGNHVRLSAPLLGRSDPLPFRFIDRRRVSRRLVVADHAGVATPQGLRRLGLGQAVFRQHIAGDLGSRELALLLAERLGASLVLANYSRLVVDLNRHLDDPTAFIPESDGVLIPGNQDLCAGEKQRRADAIYRPYHSAIDRLLDDFMEQGGLPVIISIHSFTPALAGQHRPWHVGVLWDKDARIARPLLARLRQYPDLVVGDNEPYSGRHPSDYTVAHHGEGRGIANVSIEVRQDLLADDAGTGRWSALLAEALGGILADEALLPSPSAP